jgi:hypothetical protein
MCERFPENKWTLGFASFAFAFAVGGGVILAGCPGMNIGENDQSDSDHQGAHKQPYGQIAFHVTFSFDEGIQYFVTGSQKLVTASNR